MPIEVSPVLIASRILQLLHGSNILVISKTTVLLGV
jgi:hypothetical protein